MILIRFWQYLYNTAALAWGLGSVPNSMNFITSVFLSFFFLEIEEFEHAKYHV